MPICRDAYIVVVSRLVHPSFGVGLSIDLIIGITVDCIKELLVPTICFQIVQTEMYISTFIF